VKLILCVLIPLLEAQDTETKVQMKDLPRAVQAAVKEQSKGATLVGLAKEQEGTTIRYEAEMKVNGRTRDVTFDEAGKIVTVEQEVDIAGIPAPARAAIQKSVGKGKLELVETVTAGTTTYYEAHIHFDGKEVEVKVDAHGQTVK